MSREEFGFTWKIENFSMIPYQNGTYLQSPYFVPRIFDESEWCLRLYPKGCGPKSINYLSCFIARKTFSSGNESVRIGFSLTLKSVSTSDDVCKSVLTPKFKNFCGFHKFVFVMLVTENKELYLPGDVLTIRCHMWSTKNKIIVPDVNFDLKCVSSNEFSYLTRLETGKRYVTWTITNVKKLWNSKKRTSIFIESCSKISPSFELSFSFDEAGESEYAKIEITRIKSFSDEKSVLVKCKITVLSANEKLKLSKEDLFLFGSEAEETWCFPQFITIANFRQNNYITLEDTLFLTCEFTFSFEGDAISHIEISKHSQIEFEPLNTSQKCHLTDTIQKFYFDKTLCDVTLQVGDRTFPAHKVILGAKSSVFCSMFKNDTEAKKIIKIFDFRPDTINRMLDYVYCNKLEEGLSVQDILELYSAAAKYEIQVLKNHCAILILSMLSVETVCDILLVGNRYSDSLILAHVNKFFKMNIGEICQSGQWKRFLDQYPKLVGQILVQVFQTD